MNKRKPPLSVQIATFLIVSLIVLAPTIAIFVWFGFDNFWTGLLVGFWFGTSYPRKWIPFSVYQR